ncbi:MAG: hypothetical protein JXD23_03590 [Spirochaetales bacterium]|nr:hypothetical protein [Spirochaetales bacterium]
MKNIIVIALLSAALAAPGFAQAKEVTVKAIPATMEDLVKLRDGVAKTPEGGAAVFLIAMIMYGGDNGLGLQAFTLALDMSELVPGKVYKGYSPRSTWDGYWEQVRRYSYLGRIYAKGTVPGDEYALPAGPVTFTVTEVRPQADGSVKVFAATTSGNWPRPFTVRKNDKGIWKVKEASSLFAGPADLPPPRREQQKSDEL